MHDGGTPPVDALFVNADRVFVEVHGGSPARRTGGSVALYVAKCNYDLQMAFLDKMQNLILKESD